MLKPTFLVYSVPAVADSFGIAFNTCCMFACASRVVAVDKGNMVTPKAPPRGNPKKKTGSKPKPRKY